MGQALFFVGMNRNAPIIPVGRLRGFRFQQLGFAVPVGVGWLRVGGGESLGWLR